MDLSKSHCCRDGFRGLNIGFVLLGGMIFDVISSVRMSGQTAGGQTSSESLDPPDSPRGASEEASLRIVDGSSLLISDAPALEFYLNQPGVTAPESLLTKICLGIAR